MAAYTPTVSCHKTTSGTTADTVTIGQGFAKVEVVNRDTTDFLYVTYGSETGNAATPVAEADGTLVIPPGGVLELDANNRGGFVVKVVGSDTPYSVQGVDS
jgi:hypothetical protein